MQIYKNYSLEDIPQERWLPVPGFPKYEASNLGRVKSNVKRPKILRAAMNCRGYLYVCLFHNWEGKCIKLHTIVALTFCENPNNYKEVNHIDSDKQNNNAENLEWCTRSQNMAHMIRVTGPGHRNGMTNPKATIVVHKEYGIFCTMREAAAMSGLKESNFNNMMYEIGYRKNKTKFVFA